MKYFSVKEIDEEDNKKIIGDIDECRYYLDINDDNEIVPYLERIILSDYDFYKKKKLKVVNFISFDPNNKFTDIIFGCAFSLNGFVVSDKVRLILLKYKLLEVQFTPVVNERIPPNSYYFMFFNSDLTPVIDYKHTELFIHDFFTQEIKPLNIKNRTELTKIVKKYSAIVGENIIAKKVCFKRKVDYDVFRVGQFDDNFYFSERVVNELRDNNVLGAEFYKGYEMLNNCLIYPPPDFFGRQT